MIPVRVFLKGFLSYCHAQTFMFDGAPLWVIVGSNGAGKSAIFDAILFAMYGAHRGGKANARALINQRSDNLQIEFDFVLGTRTYRAKRTLAKKGKPTLGIYDLNISPERIVPDTDKDAGFKKWVEHQIGLDEITFTASILLQQGKAEALLTADPKNRHQILSQLVDISTYARLAEKADARQKRFAGEADGHVKELNGIDPVQQTQIDTFREQIDELEDRLRNLSVRQEELAGLQIQSKQWESLAEEKQAIEIALEQARVLYDHADQIERDASRWGELNLEVPRLQRVLDTRNRIASARERIGEHEAAAHQARGDAAASGIEFEIARTNYEELSEQQECARQAKEASQQSLIDLAAASRDLQELETKHGEMEAFDTKLSQFPPNLDADHQTLQDEISALNDLRVTLPHLREFAIARGKWKDANGKASGAHKRIEGLQEYKQRLSSEKPEFELKLEAAEVETEKYNRTLIEVKTRGGDAQAAFERFEKVKGATACYYCGQPLTPAHIEQERGRLESAIQDTVRDLKGAKEEYDAALVAQNECKRELKRREKELQELDRQLGEAQGESNQIAHDVRNAQSDAERSLQQMSEDALASFPIWDGDVTALFQQSYPTDVELASWDGRVKKYTALKKQFDAMASQVMIRQNVISQRKLIAERILTLETQYPAARALEIRNQATQADAQLSAAKQKLQELVVPLTSAQSNRTIWSNRVSDAENQKRIAIADAEQETARCGELERVLASYLNELPDEWRNVAMTLDQAQYDLLSNELHALVPSVEERTVLKDAQQRQQTRKDRLLIVERGLGELPAEAKRSHTDLESEADKTRQEHADVEGLRDTSKQKKQELERRRDRRNELETKRVEAAKQTQLYKELARLLGREYLQRHLLQQAETEIVKHANQILDRISSGTLRLELRPQPAPKAKQKMMSSGVKALDLLAYNSATGQNAQPVDFLSGSQRFRAAVSLALGIGQWSRHGVRVNDAVIIDEGFGSLDKHGRREMIEQLHALTGVLGRIILVSHQEEFAGAFANRYFVELRDGASHASLMDDV